MENSPTKSQIMDAIHKEYRVWEGLLAQLDDAKMVQLKIGEWTIKDIIAHLAWHEKEMVGMLKAHALTGSPWWNLPTDQRNHLIFEENKDRPLDDVREEANLAHKLLMQLLESLPEEDLYDASRFAGMPLDWQPWMLLVQNTYEHYQDHIRDLRALLKSK